MSTAPEPATAPAAAPTWRVIHGDCLDVLPTLPDASVDAVITDPPYPHIKRDYGYWTTEEWWALVVEGVVPEVRRILKPTGSAVFILQPNSKHVGQMRGWLWRFMYWVTENWNQVQDVWWWNITALPTGLCTPRERGLLRASLKVCIWAGNSDCYREQGAVLWEESLGNVQWRLRARCLGLTERIGRPSGQGIRELQCRDAAVERGGVTPFNVLPIPNNDSRSGAGAYGHGAGTPLKLADWWTRYIVPPGGVVCDPFCGSGTMGVAALNNGCSFIGIDTVARYCEIAEKRIGEAAAEPRQAQLELEAER